MKKHIKLLTIGTLLLGGLTGCNDFLDREPLDKVIPEKYFASESDLAAYTINAYPFETVTDAYGINFFGKDNDTDNQASGQKKKCVGRKCDYPVYRSLFRSNRCRSDLHPPRSLYSPS